MTYYYENGMRKRLAPGSRTANIKERLSDEQAGDDLYIEDKGGQLRRLGDDEVIQEGARVHTIPRITKGTDRRLRSEVDLLKKLVRGGGREVTVGKKNISGQSYTGIIVTRVPISLRKFTQGLTSLLFLLPESYPQLPPLGCYLRYPPTSRTERDHHLTLQGYYGAPTLKEEGWYWYCVGLGKHFAHTGYANGSDIGHIWKPGSDPRSGHNLVTLYNMARYAINASE